MRGSALRPGSGVRRPAAGGRRPSRSRTEVRLPSGRVPCGERAPYHRCHRGLPSLLAHPADAESATRLHLIVRATAETEVLDGRRTAPCERQDVVELEEPSLPAAVSRGSQERAAAAVAHPDRSPHRRADVAAWAGGCGCGRGCGGGCNRRQVLLLGLLRRIRRPGGGEL